MKSPASSCSCFFSLHCSHLHPFSIVAFCLACRSFVNATTITIPQSYFHFHLTQLSTCPPSSILLHKGTNGTFLSPVPGFRPISCSNRVQTTIFPLLYPFSVVFPVQTGYRSHFFLSCTLAVVLMFSNQHHLRMAALKKCILPPALCNLHSQEKSVSRMSETVSCCTAHPSFAFPF